MKNIFNSVRFKLFIVPLLLIIISIGSVGFVTSSLTRESLLEQMEEHGFATAIDFIDRVDADNADLETIQARLERITENPDVPYAFFINNESELIANSDTNQIGVNFEDEGTKSALINQTPYSREWHYEKDDITVLAVTYPAVIDGEHVGAISMGYSLASTNAAIARNVRIIMISGIFAILVIGGTLFITSNNAIGMLNRLRRHIDLMATGDFTLPVPEDMLNSKDEFGLIAGSLDRMENSIVSAVKNILSASEQLAASSEELTATSEQSAVASDEVANVIQDIANGSSDQAVATDTGTSSVLELGDLVDANKEDLNTLSLTTIRAEKLKDEGIDILNELVESTKLNTSSSEEILKVIIETNESAQEISSASEMIQNIADQTNLLALNASIEAARAGEQGRGFAVVAQEIETLATQSSEFTQEISTIINELTSKTASAVATMGEVERITDSQSDSVTLTNDRFAGIADAIEDIKQVFENVDKSSDIMSDKNDQIITVMQQLSAISQENAAGTEEAAASVEEQSATVEEVANASEELAKLAGDLNLEMDYFKI